MLDCKLYRKKESIGAFDYIARCDYLEYADFGVIFEIMLGINVLDTGMKVTIYPTPVDTMLSNCVYVSV